MNYINKAIKILTGSAQSHSYTKFHRWWKQYLKSAGKTHTLSMNSLRNLSWRYTSKIMRRHKKTNARDWKLPKRSSVWDRFKNYGPSTLLSTMTLKIKLRATQLLLCNELQDTLSEKSKLERHIFNIYLKMGLQVGGGREAQQQGNICILRADSRSRK